MYWRKTNGIWRKMFLRDTGRRRRWCLTTEARDFGELSAPKECEWEKLVFKHMLFSNSGLRFDLSSCILQSSRFRTTSHRYAVPLPFVPDSLQPTEYRMMGSCYRSQLNFTIVHRSRYIGSYTICIFPMSLCFHDRNPSCPPKLSISRAVKYLLC